MPISVAGASIASCFLTATILGVTGGTALVAGSGWFRQTITINRVAWNTAREDEMQLFQHEVTDNSSFRQLAFQWQALYETCCCSCCYCGEGSVKAALRLDIAIRRVLVLGMQLPPFGPKLLKTDKDPINNHGEPIDRDKLERQHMLRDPRFRNSPLVRRLRRDMLLSGEVDNLAQIHESDAANEAELRGGGPAALLTAQWQYGNSLDSPRPSISADVLGAPAQSPADSHVSESPAAALLPPGTARSSENQSVAGSATGGRAHPAAGASDRSHVATGSQTSARSSSWRRRMMPEEAAPGRVLSYQGGEQYPGSHRSSIDLPRTPSTTSLLSAMRRESGRTSQAAADPSTSRRPSGNRGTGEVELALMPEIPTELSTIRSASNLQQLGANPRDAVQHASSWAATSDTPAEVGLAGKAPSAVDTAGAVGSGSTRRVRGSPPGDTSVSSPRGLKPGSARAIVAEARQRSAQGSEINTETVSSAAAALQALPPPSAGGAASSSRPAAARALPTEKRDEATMSLLKAARTNIQRNPAAGGASGAATASGPKRGGLTTESPKSGSPKSGSSTTGSSTTGSPKTGSPRTGSSKSKGPQGGQAGPSSG